MFYPGDDRRIAQAALGTAEDVDRAVTAAQRAFEQHRGMTYQEREAWLLELASLLQHRAAEFVDLIIEETGSAITKAEREVKTSVMFLRSAAGTARRLTGQTLPTQVPGRHSYSVREPIGVVAGIAPFNVPLIKAVKHSAMPLATGNACVLLPSEESPSCAVLLGRLFQEAGVPDGLLNVVCGVGSQIGDFLTTDERIRFVGFTGSHRVGRHVQELCGRFGKGVTLELGGLNPLIVLSDASLQRAIRCAVLGGFLYQGQICMASSRVFVEASVFDDFANGFVAAAQQLKPGDLRDAATVIGPIINARLRARIQQHIDDAVRLGASVRCGNEWSGNCLLPTVLTDVPESALMNREETFGPVVSLVRVDSAKQALHVANSTSFGLCAAVHTNDLSRAMRMTDQLNFGMVHVNAATIQEEAHIPFGGQGDSGFGREGTEVSVDDLTQWKWVTVQPLPGP